MFRFFLLQFSIRWKQLKKQLEQLYIFNHGDERRRHEGRDEWSGEVTVALVASAKTGEWRTGTALHVPQLGSVGARKHADSVLMGRTGTCRAAESAEGSPSVYPSPNRRTRFAGTHITELASYRNAWSELITAIIHRVDSLDPLQSSLQSKRTR